MTRSTSLPVFLMLLIAATATSSASAVEVSENLLPATAKGWISVPSVDDLKARWEKTDLGELTQDPVMQPFVEDLRSQLRTKLSQTGAKLGITWDDLEGVAGGEVSITLTQPGDANSYALAMLVDITGKRPAADALLKKISTNQKQKGATQATQTIKGVTVTVYTFPKKPNQLTIQRAYQFIHKDVLASTTTQDLATFIIDRINGTPGDTLASLARFRQPMDRISSEIQQGMSPQARWFIEPFGYAEASRAAQGGRKKRGTDMLKILKSQGFTAIQGIAGHVFLATGQQEVMHRTHVFAPPVARAADDENQDRFDLAARMLDFPNTADIKPQPWVPKHLSTHVTFNWKMKEAFHYAETLVNAYMEADVWDDLWHSLATDPSGPQVDIPNEMVAFFDERATFFTDNVLPITPKSERWMFAIKLTNPDAVEKTLEKMLKDDPKAKERKFEGEIIWEVVNEEEEDEFDLNIDGPGDDFNFDSGAGGFDFGEPEEVEEETALMPNSALTVAHGHLIVASSVELVEKIFKQPVKNQNLTDAADYQQVEAALTNIGADKGAFRVFSRTDQAYQPTYELIRQGKMPESETMFGKLLNRILGPDEEGVVREQEIDGGQLPPFEKVQHYFGPAGLFVRSEDDGWYVSGCLLTKGRPAVNVGAERPALTANPNEESSTR